VELTLSSHGRLRLAEPADHGVVISTPQEALDLIGNASFAPADAVLVAAGQLAPEFFDLSTGLAGEVTQKLVNYRLLLAVLGRPPESSASLEAFIIECGRGGPLVFAADRGSALRELKRRLG